MGSRSFAMAGLAAAALALAACGSSGTSTPSAPGTPAAHSASSSQPGSAAEVKAASIGGTKVLTNLKGYTLYWFSVDTSTTSKCNGTCTTYWPPVTGPVTAGPGVTGTLGTITRSNGTTQATYDGHPLYTYSGDSAPGQNNGNGLNLQGGLWHEMTVSGAAPSPSASSGGYYH